MTKDYQLSELKDALEIAKKRLEELSSESMKKTGQLQNAMENLSEQYDVKTLKEARALRKQYSEELEEKEKELAKKEKKIQRLLVQFKELKSELNSRVE